MTIELRGIENKHALLLSLGLFLVGIGEWINHPFQTVLVPFGKLTGHPRKNSPLGIAFDIAGVALVAVAIYKLVVA